MSTICDCKELDIKLVSGYSLLYASIIIPAEIVGMILLFGPREYFKFGNAKFYEISKHGMRVKCLSSQSYENYASLFGNLLISSESNCKYIWKFKIKKMKYEDIQIGLASEFNINDHFGYDKSSLSICMDGGAWRFGEMMKLCNLKFKPKDTVTMEYDASSKKLLFRKNDKYKNKYPKFIDVSPNTQTKYRLAIRMWEPDDELQLISFDVA